MSPRPSGRVYSSSKAAHRREHQLDIMAPKRKVVGEEPPKAKRAAKLESRSKGSDEGTAASGGQGIVIEAW